MTAIFKAIDVVKKYDKHTALDHVSITVPKQSIYGLLGPNGAGKTSLIRIINQITGPDSGELFIEEDKLSPKHIKDIGYLPEERGLYRKMKVGEQALYLAQLKGMGKKEAIKRLKIWFEKFDMQSWWNKKVEELSKGMQQKVQFITTVLHEPKLLILDEPFSGFDPINTNLIKQEILELREKGATVIFSTHNMSSVEEICDHIALINQSKKILEGPVKEVKESYKDNVYEISFKGEMIAFTNALWTGAELIDKESDKEQNKATIKVNSQFSVNDILKAIIPHVKVEGIKEIVPSMNDIFIQKVTEYYDNPEEVLKEIGEQENAVKMNTK